ncbi:hypothetical protein AcW1_000247 [Taiwanofungus camphoratus]|nr:hypothetical protein AcW1_000247 [Antrodia cinnamomea]KAI0963060.1 hypothetical protein AcW1_000247 [Antrodia cinnamomea]
MPVGQLPSTALFGIPRASIGDIMGTGGIHPPRCAALRWPTSCLPHPPATSTQSAQRLSPNFHLCPSQTCIMSLFRIALASTAPAARTALASGSRALHASPAAGKSATEKVTEVADKVNKSVGRGLAHAIEKGEEATQTTKEKLGPTIEKAKETTGAATQKAKEATGTASQKANQTAAGAREGARDFKQDVQKEARK